jgi:hypothetical protein
MMHRTKTSLAAALAALAAVIAAITLTLWPRHALGAGQVEVKFTKPEQFSDAGRGTFERERTMNSLREHFGTYAARLPDAQTLRVEVMDVDLAGEQSPLRLHDTRVLRGRADWPHIKLRWSLEEGGRTLKSGDEHLSDMHYFFGLRSAEKYGDLPYERRMLDQWFRDKVAAASK